MGGRMALGVVRLGAVVGVSLLLAGCLSTSREYEQLEWERSVEAATAFAEARADYDLEIEVDEDSFSATWRAEIGLLADIVTALLLINPCDRWERLELDLEQEGIQASARVVDAGFLFFFIPFGGTDVDTEEWILQRFEERYHDLELAAVRAAEAEAEVEAEAEASAETEEGE